jgi:DNA-binding MurR/RpiR family transcriptional regulator
MSTNPDRHATPFYAVEKIQLELTRIARAGSPSEKRIAKFLIRNAPDLNGETAANLAEKLKLSPMTVGRFLRSLGFHELSELTSVLATQDSNGIGNPLRQPSWLEEETGNPAMSVYLRQVNAIQAAFKLTTLPIWHETIDMLVNASETFVTSGEQIFGTALNFYTKIAECLEGVSYIHASRAHLQLADTVANESVLVIIDANDASEILQRLSQLAQESGVRTLVITTNPVAWKSSPTTTILTAQPDSLETEFDPVQLSALMELVINAITRENLRPQQRIEKIAKLKQGLAQ